MLKNYIKVAWRNLKKQKLYSVINILGLTVGLSSFVLIFLYLQDELSYDRYHDDAENIYRFSYMRSWENGNIQAMATSGSTWGPRYKELYPEVTDFARLLRTGYPGYVKREEATEAFVEPKFYWVEPNFLDLFSYELLSGDKETAISEVDKVILSKSAATKYFGNEDPTGQVIEFNHSAGTIKLTVSGVFKDVPGNTHLKPEFLGNIQRLNQLYMQTWNYDALSRNSDAFMLTYLKVTDKQVLPKIAEDWKGFIQEALANNPNNNADQYEEAKFTSIVDLHFEPEMKWELEAPADASYIPIFLISAILVLVIACINFMNLATARSAKRAREVGLRKTFGSTKAQLIAQFYGESFLIAMISVLVCVGIVLLTLPYFNDLSGKTFDYTYMLNSTTLITLVSLGLGVGLLSGSYPALYLSGFKPISALRGSFSSGKGPENVRKGLVVFQFAISIILIISTMVVFNQLSLINSSNLSKDKDRILSIRLGGLGLGNGVETFREEIEQDSRFESTTIGNHLPRLPHFGMISQTFRFPERDNEELEWNKFDVDFNFPDAFGLQLIAGRSFDINIKSDSTGVILNESAVTSMNISPEEAIGMTIRDRVWNPQLQQQADLDGKVIGVVKDFAYKSVNTAIEPLTIWGTPSWIDRILYVKMTPGNYQDKIAALESKWKEFNPGLPMENWFMDFEFGRLYENERRMSSIFLLFCGITIFIAVLGLFALASYITDQRKKEISLRKVLGASSEKLVSLLLSHFFKLVAIAFVLATPLAWFLMNNWLDGFVYRVQVSVWVILSAGLAVAMITLITVGFDTYRTAVANPVKALRSE